MFSVSKQPLHRTGVTPSVFGIIPARFGLHQYLRERSKDLVVQVPSDTKAFVSPLIDHSIKGAFKETLSSL